MKALPNPVYSIGIWITRQAVDMKIYNAIIGWQRREIDNEKTVS